MARLLLKQPLQLGWPPKCGQHGGASFTHRYRPMRFLDILKSHWYRGDACNSVTVIWAGNDLGRCAADDLTGALSELRDSCAWWGVKLRLIDVVGSTYFDVANYTVVSKYHH